MLNSKPVLIRIPGDYWDSHIYSGRLFLFGSDRSLRKLDWRELVASHQALQSVNVAVHGAMVDAGFFYRDESKLFLADPVVSERVRSCFADIQGLQLDIDVASLVKVSHGESPFPNLHADCEIYHHRMYGGMPEGLFLARHADDEGASKLWDSAVFGLRASDSYGAVAVAAADEGLWEFAIEPGRNRDAFVPKATSPNFCTSCDWGDQSIYAWSSSAEGFLASYYTHREKGERTAQRIFDRTIRSNEFRVGATTFWGSHGRAYVLDEAGDLEVLDYDSKAVARSKRTKHESFGVSLPLDAAQPMRRRDRKASVDLTATGQRRPVAVATATFGTVLQFGNHLVVLRSDGQTDTIAGEIVTWRVFPRSLNYANQLHVVFEDRLEIYAFLHDYFVDQDEKDFGYSV